MNIVFGERLACLVNGREEYGLTKVSECLFVMLGSCRLHAVAMVKLTDKPGKMKTDTNVCILLS